MKIYLCYLCETISHIAINLVNTIKHKFTPDEYLLDLASITSVGCDSEIIDFPLYYIFVVVWILPEICTDCRLYALNRLIFRENRFLSITMVHKLSKFPDNFGNEFSFYNCTHT